MEVRDSIINQGKGLFSTQNYNKGDIIYTLTGEIYDKPTRETIYIGNNQHIYDTYGIYINHSFTPNICVMNCNLVALCDIKKDDEIMFNYNDNEINMASPFYSNDVLVCGKKQ
jgi:hypothetical protein